MKTIYQIVCAALFCIFLFQPAPIGVSQVIGRPSKEAENKEIKARIEIKQDSILDNLNKAVEKAEKIIPKQKPRIVYVTKYKVIRDTVYMPARDSTDYYYTEADIVRDSIYFEVRKKNFFQRMVGNRENDTILLPIKLTGKKEQ